ncbi:hypothetical protein [Cryptosporangium minutisporangium]|uniref:Uncharacterized protein n=1 Tax=Cryptosporangium minutisporangium TaxID=113569 RepID=A0ABP6SZ78_9ACTN
MASVTGWTRLEPHVVDRELTGALQARIADPLWLVARQYAIGALHGETGAATPVWVQVRGEAGRLTRFLPSRPDGSPGVLYDSATVPLEELVEAERLPVDAEHRRVRLAPLAGLQFLRFLADAGQSAYRNAYRERYRSLDSADSPFGSVLGRRAPDGVRLHDELRQAFDAAGGAVGGAAAWLPNEPSIAGPDVPAVTAAAARFLAWYEVLIGRMPEGEPAWRPERLEYSFAVSARLSDREKVLTAGEYAEGNLDWYAFDLDPDAELGASSLDPGGELATLSHAGPPVPLSYRGMPSARFWEFEDAEVDFGEVTAATDDLATLMLVEFAITHGNDFYLVPVEVDVGSLCRINWLVVTDCFGRQTLVRSSAERDEADGRFRLFELTVPGSTRQSVLFVPPALGPSAESSPLEHVVVFRDEAANLAWAVERIAGGPAGTPSDRAEAYQERRRREEAATQTAPQPATGAVPDLSYRLRTDLPDHWYPLLAAPAGAGARQLVLGTVPRADGSPGPPPWGRVLSELTDVAVPEEEVPRSGVEVTRAWQYARWTDGGHRLWVGRRKRPGCGEGVSGLLFDVAVPRSGAAGPQ